MAKKIPPEIIAAAKTSQVKYGIPASVSLAQWALESGWGRSTYGSNNPFGIKGGSVAAGTGTMQRTREVYHENGKNVERYINAVFRVYPSVQVAFEDHGRLLATARPYAKARQVLPDPDKFVDALTGVYATDPQYGNILKQIMRGSNLYQYNV